MRHLTRLAACLTLAILAGGCGSTPTDKQAPQQQWWTASEYATDIQAALELAGENRAELVKVFDSVPLDQRKGAAFIVATMSYPDVAAITAEVLREHIEYAYTAKARYPWTRNMPEEVFLHYVLPYRCTGEPIEAYRKYFYEQLDPIVSQATDASDAAHQVNLWLGAPKADGKQRVRFVSTEWRTQGPLETLNSGYGRCEEMTVVYMSAARSVGIPCRAASTPYWAICDNNHAWVEVWVDGHWKALGGCEPGSPWFEHPAKRAAVIYSSAIGKPQSELIYKTSGKATTINSTHNYSRTCTVDVEVRTADDKPAGGLNVVFSVYNWGSFRPFASRTADAEGKARFVTGIGEYFLSTGSGNQRAWRVVKTEPDKTLNVPLRLATDAAPDGYTFLRYPTLDEAKKSFDLEGIKPTHTTLIPPSRPVPPETFTAEEFDPSMDKELMDIISAAPEKDALVQKLKSAGGNWRQIADAIRKIAPSGRPDLFYLISTLAHIEALEVTTDFLLDDVEDAAQTHQTAYRQLSDEACPKRSGKAPSRSRQTAHWQLPDDVYRPYVLSPQFQYLHVRPWRRELSLAKDRIPLKADTLANAARSVNEWVQANVKLRNDLGGRFSYVASPLETFRSRVGDSYAIAIFTAGLLRAFGVPAQVKNDWVEFYDGAQWLPLYPHDLANFGNRKRDEKARLEYEVKPAGVKLNILRRGAVDPNPWESISVCRFENGFWGFIDWSNLKRYGRWIAVQPGTYLITAGVRDSNGDAMVFSKQMELKSGVGFTMDIPLDMLPAGERVVRQFDKLPDFELPDLEGNLHRLADKLKAGSVILTFFSLDNEPSLRMLPLIDQLKDKAKEGGAEIVAVYTDTEGKEKFEADGRLRSLKIPVLLDSKQEVAKRFIQDFDANKAKCLPSTLLISGGKIVMWDEGYNLAIAGALESALGLAGGGKQFPREIKIVGQPFEVGPDYAGEGTRALEAGDYAKAIELYRKALAFADDDAGVWYNLACAYSRAKQLDEGFEALRKSVEHGWSDFNWMDNDPDLANLRADARYKDVRK